MKKVLSVAIAILLCILFAGCGTAQSENGDVEENTTVEENVTAEENTSEENSADETGDSGDSKEIEILSIGDTVSTDSAEFTLLDFQITTKASLESGDDFYAPVDEDYSGDCFYAEDGYVLAYISYSFQNIGKTDLRGVLRDLAGGGTIYGALLQVFLPCSFFSACCLQIFCVLGLTPISRFASNSPFCYTVDSNRDRWGDEKT